MFHTSHSGVHIDTITIPLPHTSLPFQNVNSHFMTTQAKVDIFKQKNL